MAVPETVYLVDQILGRYNGRGVLLCDFLGVSGVKQDGSFDLVPPAGLLFYSY